nr:Rne/Rng family ribonuclease [Bifidobacterium margollesii]
MEAVANNDAAVNAGAPSTVSDSANANRATTAATASSEASAASEPNDQAAKPAPRRRGGRRVVRVAGAAGAKVPVKIEAVAGARARRKAAAEAVESALAELPRLKEDVRDSQERPSVEPERPATRTRRRTRASSAKSADSVKSEGAAKSSGSAKSPARTAAEDARRSRISALADELFTDKGVDAERPAARTSRRSGDAPLEFSSPEQAVASMPARPRPMTSLLFREPVLPVARPEQPVEPTAENDDDSRSDSHDDARSDDTQTVRRRRRRRTDRDPREDHDSRESQRDPHTDDARSEAHADEVERDSRNEDVEHEGESRRSRRSRRLNAQERRAAAEVEQIEQDLEYDDIHYNPIDVENDDEDDHQDSAGETRSRRRRRRSAQHEEETRETESRRSRRERDHEDEDDEGTVTRRRRRRRSKGEVEREEPQIRRSRKQQYIDEITDIEGSTRLEAKKQRRRDNRRDRSRQSTLLEQDFLARRENVNRLMVVREKERHTQISVIEDSILVEHYVSDIQEVSTVGNIYLGRVQNVLPSMEAAFVDIGQPRNGVLYAGEVNWDTTRLEGQPRRIELAFRSGDPVLVQVTKDPIGHKGARLTSQVTLAGRFLVLVPSGGMTGVSRKLPERERTRLKNIVSKIAPAEMGVIIRTAAEGASKEAIEKDLENLTKQWEHVKEAETKARNSKRPKLLQGEPDVAIRVVRDIFNDDFNKLVVEGDKVYDRIEEYLDTMAPDLKEKLEKWDPEEHQGKDVFDQWRIDSQLRKGMERKVYLPSGGSLVIDRTEAMTTIDVNTGRFIGKGKSLEETVTRCNLEASEEIARQLRLRDIGGMVMIDFVDMVLPANRDLVLRRLVECLARDRTKHQVAEVTSLGLVQMTRKRVGQGLVEAFSEECPTCKGRGFILHDKPTVSASYDDPYALKGGDPFIKTNKHNHGTPAPKEDPALPQGSTPDVKAKLAAIAAAAQAAAGEDK